MEKLKAAVIGCGAVSKNHGKALKNSSRAVLSYCVDIDKDKAEAFSKEYGGIPLTDYKELADLDVDVVHIVTPHYLHPEMAMFLLEHGKHVFCEKPLAISPYDAERMVETSRRCGKKLGVCFQNRMNNSSLEAKEIIGSGKYGKVISALALVAWDRGGKYYSESPWRGTYEKEGGSCIINQSIHTLDLLSWLTGGVEAVSAMDAHLRDTSDYETDDTAMALFKLKCGGSAVAFMSNCCPLSKVCTVEVHLEKATLTVKQSGLNIETENGSEFHPSETITGYKSEWGISHGVLIDSFYRSIQEGTSFICEADTGIEAVKIINAIQHSKGKFIEIWK